MSKAVSCGGVVFFQDKILMLYKNLNNRYKGWVLPKGTVEPNETFEQTALREVKEESGVSAKLVQYVDTSRYTFSVEKDVINKEVHWYLMLSDNDKSIPQKEEFFVDSGYYEYEEVYRLLKFQNEKNIVKKAYNDYMELKRKGEIK